MRVLRKGLQLILMACLLAVMFSVAVAMLPGQQPAAQAADNSSQIYFTCHSPMGRVIIKGKNQYGESATWRGKGRPSENYVSYVFTKGWWWKTGWVTAQWYDTNVSKWYVNDLYVDASLGDPVYLGCSHGSV